ncbi:MAG: hypothetical protein K0S65_6510 [Labilithrix sp.]|nr:hypothetical protein [Labilithrix sp.]
MLDDGKILVGGERNQQGHYEHGIVRLLPEGKLDEVFGNKGVAVGPEDEFHHGMFVQKDGKIVTCGQMQYGGKEGVVRRLTSEGAPDPTFGSIGEQKYSIAAYPQLDLRACAEAPNGKIGFVGTTSGQVLVGQVLPNGSADSTFHSFGFGVGPLVSGDQSMLEAVVIRPDGRFLSAGSSSTNDTQYGVLGSMPVSTAGSARDDTSVGPGGRRILPGAGQSPARLLLQADEKFIVAGGMGNAAVLFRLNKDGTVDTGFGTGGKAVVAFSGRSMSASGIALQADGKIVIAASHPSAYGGYGFSGFGVARLGADGKLDPTFGDQGRVLMTKDPDSLNAHVVAVQKDGRIVVAGAIAAFTTPPSGNFIVARYWH